MSWHNFLETADSPIPLIVLFVVIPIGLGCLALLGFICGIRIMTRFATREQAQSFLLAGPFGGSIGGLERRMLTWFQPATGSDT
jgi:hypothetical protein